MLVRNEYCIINTVCDRRKVLLALFDLGSLLGVDGDGWPVLVAKRNGTAIISGGIC